MSDTKLRQAFLADPRRYKAAVLSADQLALYRLVAKRGEATSSQAAIALDISVPSASTRLNVLKRKGYLAREPRTADTGGIEYVYVPTGD